MDAHLHIIKEKVLKRFSFLEDSSIFIYGSHVTGTYHAKSDIDVLILSPKVIKGNQVRKITNDVRSENINLFLMSEEAFNQSQSDSFPFAAPLEEAVRYGIRLKGDWTLEKLLTPGERQRMRWVGSLYEISQRKFHHNHYDLKKILARSTFLLWELEEKLSLEGYYSLGHIAHKLMSNQLILPSSLDPLASYLERSNILWEWLCPDLTSDHDPGYLEVWTYHLIERLRKYSGFLNELDFKPLTAEPLMFIEGHPLYANVSWQKNGQFLTMQDGGIQYTINFVKNCLMP